MHNPATTSLGTLEHAVLDYLWTHGAADVKAVHDDVGRARGITPNTVQSTLKRLCDKGLLTRVKVSHAYVYEPRCSRDDFQRLALHAVVDAVMDGEPGAMLSAFVDLTERAGREHLERLERLVAARLDERGRGE